MSMDDYCQVLGDRIPRPRAYVHESWCTRHDDGCMSASFDLPNGLNAWLESDGRSVQLIVDSERGHMHVCLDGVR